MSGPMIDLEKGWTMNNQDLATLLAELDAKVRQMTPGPWQALEQIDEKWRVDGNDDDPLARFAQGYDEQKANAHGIVALVNAYPALRAALQAEYDANFSMSAELTALHLENDRLRAQIEQLQQQLETSRMSEVEQAKRRGELGLEVVKLRRECDEARARAIRWNNEHATAEDRWVEERYALRALVARQREALRDISEHLPCDLPCKMKPAQGKCGECGAYRFETWCAGCTARAALATEEA